MNEAIELLRTSSSEVRDVFDLSASDNFAAPLLPIVVFPVMSENEMKQKVTVMQQ
jgi:hypothetical protein